MIMAWNKAHTGKPIWVTSGGAELPLVYMAIAAAVGLAGPGKYSLDDALGIEIPAPVIALTLAGVTAGIIAGSSAQPEPQPEPEPAEGQEISHSIRSSRHTKGYTPPSLNQRLFTKEHRR